MESGLASWIQTIGYLGIFAVVMVETGLLVGFALPGDSLLITVGILAAAQKLDLSIALVVLFIASFLGNNLGYWLGRWIGPKLQTRLNQRHLGRTQEFMKRFGPASVLVGPYIPVVRALVPFTCGSLGMPWWRFAVLAFLGSVLWTQGLTLLSYWVGSKIPHLERYVYLILLSGALVGLVPLAWRVLRQLRSK
jgi:membrane-associated protein